MYFFNHSIKEIKMNTSPASHSDSSSNPAFLHSGSFTFSQPSSCQPLSQSNYCLSQPFTFPSSQPFNLASVSQALSNSCESDTLSEEEKITFSVEKAKDVYKRKSKEKFTNDNLSRSFSLSLSSETINAEEPLSSNKPLSLSNELKRKNEKEKGCDVYKKLKINIPENNELVNSNEEPALDTSFDPRDKIQHNFIHPSKDKKYRNYTIASSEKNEFLNRYNNNYPDDENIYTPRNYFLLGKQIKLAPYYLNASKISFDIDEKNISYIATQAPLEDQTFNEFWKMIVAGKTKILVNLAMVLENNKMKSDDYWSNEYWTERLDEENSGNYDSDQAVFSILGTQQVDDIASSKNNRKFEIYDGDKPMGFITKAPQKDDNGQEVYDLVIGCSRYNEKERIVQRLFEFTPYDEDPQTQQIIQFHYENWPDNGIPSDKELLQTFIELIIAEELAEESMPQKMEEGPTVTHCSAGLGRTGTVIAILTIIRQIEMQIQNKQPLKIDPVKILERMRACRKGMVQSKEQFNLIYKVVRLYVKKQIKLGRIEPKKILEIKV